MKCFFCEGPAHPATACVYNERVVACGPCTRRFWQWFRGHMRRWSKPGKPDFYAAATPQSKA